MITPRNVQTIEEVNGVLENTPKTVVMTIGELIESVNLPITYWIRIIALLEEGSSLSLKNSTKVISERLTIANEYSYYAQELKKAFESE